MSDGRTTINKSLIQAVLGAFLLVQQVIIVTACKPPGQMVFYLG